MDYDFAPMEGITTAPFRQLHNHYFPGIRDYYTPFVAATQSLSFKRKEIRDFLPENNRGVQIIPQILGNKADEVAWAAEELASFGYREVNFNLGCSMPQVAKRGKGAGFLAPPERLERFFDALFKELSEKGTDVSFTVKTRIGKEDPEESRELIRIFNRYPIRALIVHPRLQTDLYRGVPNMDIFEAWYQESAHPLIYNGDVETAEGAKELAERFPTLGGIMIGRGLLRNPALVRELNGGEKIRAEELLSYMEDLLALYLDMFTDPRQAVSKMKEIWWYLGSRYPGREKELKKLKKTRETETLRELQREIICAGEHPVQTT